MKFHVEYTSANRQSKFDTDDGTTVKDVFVRVNDEITASVNVTAASPLPITVRITELADEAQASPRRKPQMQHLEDGFGGRAKRPKVPKRT
jgi:hypothetical protein